MERYQIRGTLAFKTDASDDEKISVLKDLKAVCERNKDSVKNIQIVKEYDSGEDRQ